MNEHITHTAISLDTVADYSVAVLTLDNSEGRRPNTFGAQGLAEFATALARVHDLATAGEIHAAILTGKPGSFLAGADLKSFQALTDDEEALAFSRDGKEIFTHIQTLGIPTIALLNGLALGGGLELALFCDYRVATPDAKFVGFPETYLGLVPGWAGSYHLPRLIGPEAALRVLVDNPLAGNRLLSIPDAVDIGIVDAQVQDDAETGTFLTRILTGDVPSRAPLADAAAWAAALDARRPIARARHAAGTEALSNLLDLVALARTGDQATYFARESEYARRANMSDAFRRNLYAFNLLAARPRHPAEEAPDTTPIAEALGEATQSLPGHLEAVSLEDLRPELPALVSAVRGLLAAGWTTAQIDTVALSDLKWPLYFGGILPILDVLAGTAILEPGVATVPPRGV